MAAVVATIADQVDRRIGAGTPPPDGCTSCYAYGVICALVGASLQAVGLQVRCPAGALQPGVRRRVRAASQSVR